MTPRILTDKRVGACLSGPCRMPRRCWQYVTCFLYGEGEKKWPHTKEIADCPPSPSG